MFMTCIIIMHSGIPFQSLNFLTGAYIFVDFFFVLQGYFLYKKYLYSIDDIRNPLEQSYQFIRSKFILFFSCTLCSILLLIASNIITQEYAGNVRNSIFEVGIKLVGELTFTTNALPAFVYLNGTLWFLSAYIFAGGIMVYLIVRFGEKIIFICPIVFVLINNYIIANFGSFGFADERIAGMIPVGYLRAISGIMLGLTCGYVKKKLESSKISKDSFRIKRIVWIIINFGLIVFCIFRAIYYGHTTADAIMILLFAIMIVTADLYGITRQNRIIYWIEKIIMPMYIFQYVCITFVCKFYQPSFHTTFKIIIMDVLISVTWLIICERRKTLLHKVK